MVSASLFTATLFAIIAFVSAAPALVDGELLDLQADYIGTEDITATNIGNRILHVDGLDVHDNVNDAVVGK